MRKFIIFTTLFYSFLFVTAQEEFNAIVSVNADQVQSNNKQIFTTLEKSLVEFINQTKWTSKKFLPQERINCAFTLIINSQENNSFSGSLQVQAMRPVYGASYETPILNINDTDISFVYNEFDPLLYNPNSFDNNLVSTIVFYVYTILGVDADTFKLKAGEEYFKKAFNAVRQAQQSGGPAWQDKLGESNRFALIDGFLDPKFVSLREVYYQYHRKGLDVFQSDELKAKKQISTSVLSLQKLHNITVGNYLLRVFLDAKSDEIVNVFSSGKSINNELKIQETLDRIAPTQSNKWRKIK